jgi:CHASE2 domain-containing sensor protein
MTSDPLELMRIIFVVLAIAMVIAGLTTRARPRTRRDWTLVWAVLVFLTWALLGFGWLAAQWVRGVLDPPSRPLVAETVEPSAAAVRLC